MERVGHVVDRETFSADSPVDLCDGSTVRKIYLEDVAMADLDGAFLYKYQLVYHVPEFGRKTEKAHAYFMDSFKRWNLPFTAEEGANLGDPKNISPRSGILVVATRFCCSDKLLGGFHNAT